MNIKELIDTAKEKSGLALGAMAEEMQISQVRISEWKKGKYRPAASQIIYLAERAGLPAIETLANLESESNPAMAQFWKVAVSELRQNKGLSRCWFGKTHKKRRVRRFFIDQATGPGWDDCRRRVGALGLSFGK